jgi:hypothetical protein
MAIWLRASLLDEDCDRRLAAKQWRKKIVDDGFALRATPNHIGAVMGRVNHRVFASQLEFKRDVGHIPMDWRHGLEKSLVEMDEEVDKEGAIHPDDTTSSRRELIEQVEAVVQTFHYGYLQTARPGKHLEEKLAIWMTSEKKVMLTATPDNPQENGVIDDFKTGRRKPEGPHQMGLQSIILAEHAYKPKALRSIWLPRAGKEEKEPIEYPLKESEDEAQYRVSQLVRDYEEYESLRRDPVTAAIAPLAFRANSRSETCKAGFCSAFGTPFCPLKAKEPTNGSDGV